MFSSFNLSISNFNSLFSSSMPSFIEDLNSSFAVLSSLSSLSWVLTLALNWMTSSLYSSINFWVSSELTLVVFASVLISLISKSFSLIFVSFSCNCKSFSLSLVSCLFILSFSSSIFACKLVFWFSFCIRTFLTALSDLMSLFSSSSCSLRLFISLKQDFTSSLKSSDSTSFKNAIVITIYILLKIKPF